MTTERSFSRIRLGGFILLAIGGASIAALYGAKRHQVGTEAGRLRALQEAGPRLRVAAAGANGSGRTVTLAGEAMPYAATTLYAKVSGFLRAVKVDKGSPVQAGQVLAVLESTEVDKDALALKADAQNKRRYAERVRQLANQGVTSTRDLEDAEAAARIAEEKLASQAVQQGYRNVVAPFSGVVTQRYADPGALIQNAGASSAAQPILALAQVDRLRISFYLDQQVAARVKLGQAVRVQPVDRPDLSRTVKVARLAGALDPKTRTLLAEADLDNRDGAFLAGGSVKVSFDLPGEPGRLEIPSEAVLVRGGQTLAAVVGPDHKLNLRPVLLGEDNGARVRVLGGLAAGDQVVLNPPATLKEGDPVQAVPVS